MLVEMEVEDIWAKAVSAEHARLLERIGVHHVIFPEAESGGRVAHLVNGKMEGFEEFSSKNESKSPPDRSRQTQTRRPASRRGATR